MNRVIVRSLEMQQLIFQSSVSFAIANASKPEEFLDDLSEELRNKPPVYTFPDFQVVVGDPVVPGGWKRKRKDRRERQESTQGDFSKVANVTCFFCNLKGHYAIDCPKDFAATSRPSQTVPQSRAPVTHQSGLRNLADVTCYFCHQKGHFANVCPKKIGAAPRPNGGRGQGSGHPPDQKVVQQTQQVGSGRVTHVSAEEAQEAPDVVMGTFLVHSYPATVLFDSGASHSFISSSFAAMGDIRVEIGRAHV